MDAKDCIVLHLRACGAGVLVSFSVIQRILEDCGLDGSVPAIRELLLELQCRDFVRRAQDGFYLISPEHAKPHLTLPSFSGGNGRWRVTLRKMKFLLEICEAAGGPISQGDLIDKLLTERVYKHARCAQQLLDRTVHYGRLRELDGAYLLAATDMSPSGQRALGAGAPLARLFLPERAGSSDASGIDQKGETSVTQRISGLQKRLEDLRHLRALYIDAHFEIDRSLLENAKEIGRLQQELAGLQAQSGKAWSRRGAKSSEKP